MPTNTVTLLPDTQMRLLRVAEVATLLSLSRAMVYKLIRAGELESIRLGCVKRVRFDKLMEFIERRTAKEGNKGL